MRNKSGEHCVQSCLRTGRDVSNVDCVHDGNGGNSHVVKLKSDVHCVQSGKIVDCCKNSTDDSSSITFEEDNNTSTVAGNNLKRNHSMRDDSKAKASADRKFDNFKKRRYENSFFHSYKSNANSSVRTKVAAKVIYNVRDIVQKEINTTAPLKNMLATERVRIEHGRKKDKKIDSLPLIKTFKNKVMNRVDLQAVSYTHLTLPTTAIV